MASRRAARFRPGLVLGLPAAGILLAGCGGGGAATGSSAAGSSASSGSSPAPSGGVGGQAVTGDWVTVQGNGFSVMLLARATGTPSIFTEDGHVVHAIVYGIQINAGGTYLVDRLDYDAGALLSASKALQGAASNTGGTLTAPHALTVAGRPAMDGAVTGAKGTGPGGTVYLRVIIDKKTCYILEYFATTAPSTTPSEFLKMVDSFRLT
jgi:hypothetical protein